MTLLFPPIYLLNFRIPTDEVLKLEREIGEPLVRDISEARVVIGKVTKRNRVQLEFKSRGVYIQEVVRETESNEAQGGSDASRPKKRRKVDKVATKEVITIDSSTEPDSEATSGLWTSPLDATGSNLLATPVSITPEPQSAHDDFGGNSIKVLTLDWYFDSVKAGTLLPTKNYLVYEGRIIAKPNPVIPGPKKLLRRESIISRAQADTPLRGQAPYKHHPRKRESQDGQSTTQPPRLSHQTSSEHDRVEALPPLPSYLRSVYSCQRPSPAHSPNAAFISQLKVIRHGRRLDRDDRGISALAYSKAMAAITAYPYTLTSPVEIARLPNCGQRYVELYQEWKETGRIQEVEQIESDERMKSLKEFYEIYDVGEKTARQFYARGWRDLDDIISQGWDMLTPNQQVGVKFYDDFQEKIPRDEVERIAAVVLRYANQIRPGFHMVIVGGYRKGKTMCGDVDIILSHPDEDATDHVVEQIVWNLAEDKWITHRLTVSTANSERGQETVSWKGSIPKTRGGFCTLDKALVVWQDADLAKNPDPEKPNPRRRVDIILTPWRTAGCAILGWSGDTMFERDLRKYCRNVRGVKFDSTGVRRLSDGTWLDLEHGAKDLLEKERKVFEGLELEWRPPEERCTG
jgi:DNA polymerase IV